MMALAVRVGGCGTLSSSLRRRGGRRPPGDVEIALERRASPGLEGGEFSSSLPRGRTVASSLPPAPSTASASAGSAMPSPRAAPSPVASHSAGGRALKSARCELPPWSLSLLHGLLRLTASSREMRPSQEAEGGGGAHHRCGKMMVSYALELLRRGKMMVVIVCRCTSLTLDLPCLH